MSMSSASGITNVEAGNPDITIKPLRCEAWAPRPQIAPRFSGSWDSTLRIESGGSAGCYGGFELFYPPGKGGEHFLFSVEVRWKGLKYGFESLSAEASWVGTDTWSPILDRQKNDDGWLTLSQRLAAPRLAAPPGEATALSVKLLLRWSATGVVEWRRPRLIPIPPPPPRRLRLGAASSPLPVYPPPTSVQDNLERLLKVGRRAAAQGVQLLCLPEVILSWGLPDRQNEDPYAYAVTVPGPETDAFCRLAADCRMAICLPVKEREKELLRNTAVLIDEDGNIVAKYHKVHLAPPLEMWWGITPGDQYVVAPIKTAGARVGMNICMDSSVEEAARCTARLGAEILCLPIMGDHRATARWEPGPHNFDICRWMMIHQMRAMDNQIYLVVARNNGFGSGIFAPDGTTLVMDGGNFPIVHADVDLNNLKRRNVAFKDVCWYERREATYGCLAGDLLPVVDENW
ncbi:MAG TPA: carbon-nitrogen hydrolase family protein [Firmicutes bacterium]|nr:carbon-nitrogen hydrolase family protein [Bacillota bacterium]